MIDRQYIIYEAMYRCVRGGPSFLGRGIRPRFLGPNLLLATSTFSYYGQVVRQCHERVIANAELLIGCFLSLAFDALVIRRQKQSQTFLTPKSKAALLSPFYKFWSPVATCFPVLPRHASFSLCIFFVIPLLPSLAVFAFR